MLYCIILNVQFFLTRCIQHMMEVLKGKNALRNKEYQKVFRAVIKTQDITSLNNFTQ